MTIGPTKRRGSLRLPSTDALRAFEAVARLGNFERAARELSLTASAIRKRISALEEIVGTSLFERKAHSVFMTDRGLHYLDAVKDILGLLIALPFYGEEAQDITRLRITATPTFARQILAPNLSGFANLYSNIDLELVVVPPVFDYPSTNADVEIRAGNGVLHGGIALTHDVVLPMASPVLLKSIPAIQTPSDLRYAPLIRTPLEPWQPWFQAAQLDWPEPTQGPKFQDLGLTYEAAVKGHGVALCRLGLVKDWLITDALRPLFPICSLPVNQYYALTNASHTKEVELFLEWLQALCAEQSELGQELVQQAMQAAPASPSPIGSTT